MKVKLFFISILLLITTVGYAQDYDYSSASMPEGKTVVFRFVGDNDTFYIPWQHNGEKLDELVATVDHYKKIITDGVAKISVAGYSSFYDTASENLKSAAIRANRVKSELILRNGIREENFHTTVHASPFDGWKSVVVVTLNIPEPRGERVTIRISSPQDEQEKPKNEPVMVEEETVEVYEPIIVESSTKPYCIAFRTNLLYDAFALPTLGVEWRISDLIGLRADWSGSYWGKKTSSIQKVWVVNPELRFYMGDVRRWYAGVAGNYGKYNIYRGMIGKIASKDTGYQGSFWNAGISGGYQWRLNKAFTIDFNLGLGYSRFSYDTFSMVNKVRVSKAKNQTKNIFGPTQVGVNLVWTIGGNK